jgi:hypothetical protein
MPKRKRTRRTETWTVRWAVDNPAQCRELTVDPDELDLFLANCGRLVRLRELQLIGCDLERLPKDLEGLRSLRSLDLSLNRLEAVPLA